MSLKHYCRIIGYSILPLHTYLKLCYKYIYKRPLHLKNPRAFSEKLYWLKLYYQNHIRDLIQKCYDKYTVREYVTEKIGGKYLNTLYGVYSSADEINFEELPEQFVLKITQSSGMNIICPDKQFLDIEATKKTLNKWLSIARKAKYQEQSNYFNGDAKIICEEFLHLETGEIPADYRIYCFNGTPKFIIHDLDTTLENGQHGHDIKRNVYDSNWNFIEVDLGRPRDEKRKVPCPSNLDEILEVSAKLSKDFPFVRVDLYNVNGKIIFGELTWIPMGGNCPINPDSFDFELGTLLKLPQADF